MSPPKKAWQSKVNVVLSLARAHTYCLQIPETQKPSFSFQEGYTLPTLFLETLYDLDRTLSDDVLQEKESWWITCVMPGQKSHRDPMIWLPPEDMQFPLMTVLASLWESLAPPPYSVEGTTGGADVGTYPLLATHEETHAARTLLQGLLMRCLKAHPPLWSWEMCSQDQRLSPKDATESPYPLFAHHHHHMMERIKRLAPRKSWVITREGDALKIGVGRTLSAALTAGEYDFATTLWKEAPLHKRFHLWWGEARGPRTPAGNYYTPLTRHLFSTLEGSVLENHSSKLKERLWHLPWPADIHATLFRPSFQPLTNLSVPKAHDYTLTFREQPGMVLRGWLEEMASHLLDGKIGPLTWMERQGMGFKAFWTVAEALKDPAFTSSLVCNDKNNGSFHALHDVYSALCWSVASTQETCAWLHAQGCPLPETLSTSLQHDLWKQWVSVSPEAGAWHEARGFIPHALKNTKPEDVCVEGLKVFFKRTNGERAFDKSDPSTRWLPMPALNPQQTLSLYEKALSWMGNYPEPHHTHSVQTLLKHRPPPLEKMSSPALVAWAVLAHASCPDHATTSLLVSECQKRALRNQKEKSTLVDKEHASPSWWEACWKHATTPSPTLHGHTCQIITTAWSSFEKTVLKGTLSPLAVSCGHIRAALANLKQPGAHGHASTLLEELTVLLEARPLTEDHAEDVVRTLLGGLPSRFSLSKKPNLLKAWQKALEAATEALPLTPSSTLLDFMNTPEIQKRLSRTPDSFRRRIDNLILRCTLSPTVTSSTRPRI